MSDGKACPSCRSPIPADAPDGACPRCLFAEGLGAPRVPSAADVEARLPAFEVLGVLGQGGMGVVYKARQKALDRIVALKVLPPAAAASPGFAERFAREAKAMARLQHPNIVAVFDFGPPAVDVGEPGGDFFWLSMEFVDGLNVREAMRAGRIGPKEALAIVPQICDALQYAHDRGVVHRDIKPENILIDREGRVKVVDFGLAKLAERSPTDVSLTGAGQVMGTLHYMAPEQWERPKDVDHRADIYSLGVVFYEMLTGELPVGRFEPPSRRVEVDVRVDDIVLRSLERQRDRRYQNVSEVKTGVDAMTSGAAARPSRVAESLRQAADDMEEAVKGTGPGGVTVESKDGKVEVRFDAEGRTLHVSRDTTGKKSVEMDLSFSKEDKALRLSRLAVGSSLVVAAGVIALSWLVKAGTEGMLAIMLIGLPLAFAWVACVIALIRIHFRKDTLRGWKWAAFGIVCPFLATCLGVPALALFKSGSLVPETFEAARPAYVPGPSDAAFADSFVLRSQVGDIEPDVRDLKAVWSALSRAVAARNLYAAALLYQRGDQIAVWGILEANEQRAAFEAGSRDGTLGLPLWALDQGPEAFAKLRLSSAVVDGLKIGSGRDETFVTARVDAMDTASGRAFRFDLAGQVHDDAAGRWIEWTFRKDGFHRP